MPNAYLCPILQQNQFTDNANFLAGGRIWFYLAGSTTPATAYTTETADVAWSNPIVLNQRGEVGGEIWLSSGISYKIVLENKPYDGETHGVVISTFDDINGVNDVSLSAGITSWIAYPETPNRIDDNSFSVTGDAVSTFQQYRRIRSLNGSGYLYSTISSSSYASGITTVNVVNDTTGFDTEFSKVYYGFVETSPSSIPKCAFIGSSSVASTNQIYLDYVSSKMNFAIDNGALSDTWPINVDGDTGTFVTGDFTTVTATTGNIDDVVSVNGDFSTSLQVNSQDVWTNTNNTTTLASSGSANFKNGLQLRWGPFSATSGGTAIAFSSAFPAGAYAVTISDTGSDTKITALSASGFTATSATSSTGFYIAVGH